MRKQSLAALLAACVIFVFGLGVAAPAFAEQEVYSGVLEDLQKDNTFDVYDYPVIPGDFSLQVIHVAESLDDELFVYVYQPSGDTANLRATSIMIAKGYKTLDFKNYKLKYCNSKNALYKYKVEGFTVQDTRLRYYDITSIYRAWSSKLGDKDVAEGTVNEVAYPVNTLYEIGEKAGQYVVTAVPTDTIHILSKHVAFIRYRNGFRIGSLHKAESCDSHFVAFSTDIPIDRLSKADIYYTTQSCKRRLAGNVFGETVEQYAFITDDPELQFTYETEGWFNVGTITRDRIATVEDFIAAEDIQEMYPFGMFDVTVTSSIDEEHLDYLRECDWVIRFAETPYELKNGSSDLSFVFEEYTIVGNVSILRLEGISNGEEFNLGVIDNKQTGSGKPANSWGASVGMPWWAWIVIAVILIVLCIMFRPVWLVVRALLLGVYFFISALPRLIVWIAEKIKEKQEATA